MVIEIRLNNEYGDHVKDHFFNMENFGQQAFAALQDLAFLWLDREEAARLRVKVKDLREAQDKAKGYSV